MRKGYIFWHSEATPDTNVTGKKKEEEKKKKKKKNSSIILLTPRPLLGKNQDPSETRSPHVGKNVKSLKDMRRGCVKNDNNTLKI